MTVCLGVNQQTVGEIESKRSKWGWRGIAGMCRIKTERCQDKKKKGERGQLKILKNFLY